jgi:hypothetical protein
MRQFSSFPGLTPFSLYSLSPDLAADKLREIIAMVHDEGGVAGIHCCGNADWPLLFRGDVWGQTWNPGMFPISPSIAFISPDTSSLPRRANVTIVGSFSRNRPTSTAL